MFYDIDIIYWYQDRSWKEILSILSSKKFIDIENFAARVAYFTGVLGYHQYFPDRKIDLNIGISALNR
jgi:hypothetical protein